MFMHSFEMFPLCAANIHRTVYKKNMHNEQIQTMKIAKCDKKRNTPLACDHNKSIDKLSTVANKIHMKSISAAKRVVNMCILQYMKYHIESHATEFFYNDIQNATNLFSNWNAKFIVSCLLQQRYQ